MHRSDVSAQVTNEFVTRRRNDAVLTRTPKRLSTETPR